MRITLTTTGAVTGQSRSVTLYAWEDGERLVIVGSLGGAAHNPAWVHNLRADPHASVRTLATTTSMLAHEVTDAAERSRLWQLVVDRFPLYATYQRRTKRQIPLFTLTPAP